MTTVPPSPLRRSVTGRVLVVAHGGLSAEEPENTMRSFRRAAEVGCDLIELDVHLSSDGRRDGRRWKRSCARVSTRSTRTIHAS